MGHNIRGDGSRRASNRCPHRAARYDTRFDRCRCETCVQPVPPSASTLRLPPLKAKLYTAVSRRPGITADELADQIWSEDPDGGPTGARQTVHVHVLQTNKLLTAAGSSVRI